MGSAEFKAADQRLGEAYKNAAAALPDEDKSALLKEQRAWAAKRERDAFAKFSKGTPDYARFLIEKADERVAALQAYTDTVGRAAQPQPHTALSIGGTYKFGVGAEKGPVGSILVYPFANNSALFLLEVSRGAPSYNSGRLFGQMAIKDNVGTYKDADGLNCALKFKFATQELEIVTEEGRDDCGFGGNVSADNKYKLIDKAIPKYYTNVEDEKFLFEDAARSILGEKKEAVKPVAHGGQTYKTVRIGTQTWMAENLNYKIGNSWCYDNSESNCRKYGRLYTWNAAVKACPSGWHLPDTAEWNKLMAAIGGAKLRNTDPDNGNGGKPYDYYESAGKKLKSKIGWKQNDGGKSGNGADEFGYSALPGGFRLDDGSFGYAGNFGYWWSATEYGSGSAYHWNMINSEDSVNEFAGDRSHGYSARCVKD
jgi:uncharacterized protein (TIGR02145 family)